MKTLRSFPAHSITFCITESKAAPCSHTLVLSIGAGGKNTASWLPITRKFTKPLTNPWGPRVGAESTVKSMVCSAKICSERVCVRSFHLPVLLPERSSRKLYFVPSVQCACCWHSTSHGLCQLQLYSHRPAFAT